MTDRATIEQAVEAGYVVRTRADTPISQAQSGNTTMQDAAFASGAQWVSTDYPVPGLTKLLGVYGLPFADYVSPLPPTSRGAALVAERAAPADAPLRGPLQPGQRTGLLLRPGPHRTRAAVDDRGTAERRRRGCQAAAAEVHRLSTPGSTHRPSAWRHARSCS